MEVISGQSTRRYTPYPKNPETERDTRDLVSAWVHLALRTLKSARLHFGLQNEPHWNGDAISQRFPQEAYDSLVDMHKEYDPHDLTRNAFLKRILEKASNDNVEL